MRILVLSLFGLAASLYSFAALDVYREEQRARAPVRLDADAEVPAPRHPELNLKTLRAAFATEKYTDSLVPYLEGALVEAPSSYQSPFLLAMFYANRLEKPAVVRRSFEVALARFPANGRLHMTFAEWLLTPRASAPYRAYRVTPNDEDSRRQALEEIAAATELEPELTGRALDLLVRFRVPQEEWRALLPDGASDEATMRLILGAVERSTGNREARRGVLENVLAESGDTATLRQLCYYASRWGETELALSAAERWHALSLTRRSADLVEATVFLATRRLEGDDEGGAYEVLRDTLAELDRRRLVENSVELLVKMANAYLGRRRLAMAQSLYTEAATVSPHDARAHLGLARIYRRSGDDDAALRELEQVLASEPGNEAARAELDAIRSEASTRPRR